MKILAALLSVLFLNLAASSNVKESCNPAECVAPDCRCFSQSPPDGLDPEDIPQLVFLTFDEAITKTNMVNYSSILHNRKNPNDCPVTMTFFVTHDSNDYTFTHQLFYTGNEIASASISHSTPAQTWASKTVEEWTDELGGMRQTLAKFANIPIASIQGERAPFLQTSGDVTFQAMQKSGLKWDCSYPTIKYSEPAAFPYTMDYGFAQDCQIKPCPTSTYPGVWNVPMVVLRDVEGHTCSMADGCANRFAILSGIFQDSFRILTGFLRNFRIFHVIQIRYILLEDSWRFLKILRDLLRLLWNSVRIFKDYF